MPAASLVVEDFAGLMDLPTAYGRALAEGASGLDVELRPGCYGLDPAEASGTIVLAPAAGGPAPLDLRLRAPDGPCVLAGIPLRAAGRRVVLEGVALIGLTSCALSLVATDAVELDRVTVLDVTARTRERSAVAISAAGPKGTVLEARDTVIARAGAPDAVVGCVPLAGSWFESVALTRCTLAAAEAPALLSIDATAVLRLLGCRMRAPTGRTLLRMGWPPNDGEIRDSVLSASADRLLVLAGGPPGPQGTALRLEDGTSVTAALGDLPAHVTASGGVRETAGETVDAAVEAAVREAAERLAAVDGRLAERLLP
jgi:hypothetical protein